MLLTGGDPSKILGPIRHANVGETAKMICHYRKSVTWFFYKVELPPNANPYGSDGQFLNIYQTSLNNSGFYYCSGVQNSHIMISKTQLKVYGKFIELNNLLPSTVNVKTV